MRKVTRIKTAIQSFYPDRLFLLPSIELSAYPAYGQHEEGYVVGLTVGWLFWQYPAYFLLK